VKHLIVLLMIFSLYPVSPAFSEGRGGGGGGGSFGGGGGNAGGESRGGGGDFGGGSAYQSDNSFSDRGNYSVAYSSRGNNVRSGNLGTRRLGSSYFNSRRNFSFSGRQNSFNRGYGYSLSNRNYSSGDNEFAHLGGNPSRYVASSIVPSRLKSLGVKNMPHSVLNTQMPDVGRNSPQLVYPRVGPTGTALHAVAVTPRTNAAFVRTHMATFMNNRSFMSNVNGFNRTENQAGRYYWHNWNGSQYCHYCDGNGCNWYGCYDGGNCFWGCYYGDNWWWFDQAAADWCYWDQGNWWWQNPYNVNQTDLYDNGSYTPADDSQASAATSENADAAAAPIIFRSKDGTRQVKITGQGEDAFLFDTATPPAFQPVYLASDVANVIFSNSKNGQPTRIAVTLADGSFDLFDDQGQPVQ